jgi:orotidine 5'-phosphate decarboxylase subfamily 2
MDFLEKLMDASRNKSLLCVGLDPNRERMPQVQVPQFNRGIMHAILDLVCAHKPNSAFCEALGIEGQRALARTLAHIPKGIPVIGDGNGADVSASSEVYARAQFETFCFDAATVNPYLVQCSIAPFIVSADGRIFIWCKTSNPGSANLQESVYSGPRASGSARPLFELVPRKAKDWETRSNIGLVAGATYPLAIEKSTQDLSLPSIVDCRDRGLGCRFGSCGEIWHGY